MQVRLRRFSSYAFVLVSVVGRAPRCTPPSISKFSVAARPRFRSPSFPSPRRKNSARVSRQWWQRICSAAGCSGWLIRAGLRPHEPVEVSYPDWINRGASALVIGSTTTLAGGQVAFRVPVAGRGKTGATGGYTETVPAEQLRAAAHRIADMIYEKLTGDVGVFSTRIAYVVKQGKKYSLQVADADGYNSQPVIEYTEPIISPAWSPDGTSWPMCRSRTRNRSFMCRRLRHGRARRWPISGEATARPHGRRTARSLRWCYH